MIAFDTETTGVDMHHGARPFFLTMCWESGEQIFYEWDVNPLTRLVSVPPDDLAEIWERFAKEDRFVLQNAKFDIAALGSIDPTLAADWRWTDTVDTLIGGHLLASNLPHDLTSMGIQYLGRDIEPFELKLKDACKQARSLARRHLPTWAIAKAGRKDMPSLKGTGTTKKVSRGSDEERPWKFDSWLPRTIVRYAVAQLKNHYWEKKALPRNKKGLPIHPWWWEYANLDHPWNTVLSEYANTDSACTIALWIVMEQEIKRRGLEKIFYSRMQLLPIIAEMEHGGITMIQSHLKETKERFIEERQEMEQKCLAIARSRDYQLVLPKGASPNKSLRTFCFNYLNLPALGLTDSGMPSLTKEVLEQYELTLPKGDQLDFIVSMRRKRKRDTGLSYIESYERFGLVDGVPNVLQVYPSINPTGTNTLRFSMHNPNGQQVSKQETGCPLCKGDGCLKCKMSGKDLRSLRYIFGPAPGREWYCLDYENIELRIPAYEAGEDAMIELFEKPDEPPYYGSNHFLFFAILHPEAFAKYGKSIKTSIEPYRGAPLKDWYQWTKNGDFAVQYGAVAESGTADRAYHVPGAQAKIESYLKNIKKLSMSQIAFANKHGYVETIPDKTVDPKRGYPLLCTRSKWGKVEPTVPLSYHIQGTAMWCTCKAMIRCHEQCREWSRIEGKKYHIILQVHDELVFDFPRGGPKNFPKVRKLKRLMEESGDDIDVPLKVSVSYCPVAWSEGKGI
jgi:DNA polymerase I-like protein with 3'-5' exonuclease and polymerase domains